MKARDNFALLLSFLITAGLLACMLVERRACAKLAQENQSWRQQLGQLERLQADNQRLSNLVTRTVAAPATTKPTGEALPAIEPRGQELVRLRSEVEALHRQNQELETLRADTRQAQAAQAGARHSQGANSAASSSGSSSGAPFEILQAQYGTEETNWDVADELRDRIRGDQLKALASNKIKGDPHFGKVKRLSIVYRFGGVTLTNEFREGDVVILPKEEE